MIRLQQYLNGKVRNDSGEDMPPFSLFPIIDPGVVVVRGISRVVGGKSGSTFYRDFGVTGPTVLKNGLVGPCQLGPLVIVGYDASYTPARGEGFGAKVSQFTAHKGWPCCLIVRGIIDSTNKLMLAALHPICRVKGKADSSIAALASDVPGSGTMSLYYFDFTDSTYKDTTQNITAYNDSLSSVSTARILHAKEINGLFSIDFESCGA